MGGHLSFTWSAGGLTEIFDLSNIHFLPPPPNAPLYINNDRSLMTNEKTNVYASE